MQLHNILLGAPPWLESGVCVLFIKHFCTQNVAVSCGVDLLSLSVDCKIEERSRFSAALGVDQFPILGDQKRSVRAAVIVVPIAIGVPPAIVFIPPPVIGAPAILAGLVQLVARMIRLLAVPAVVLHGFVQFVIGFRQTMLTFAFIRPNLGRTREQQKPGQGCAGQDQFPKPVPSQSMSCFHSISPVFQRRSMGTIHDHYRPSGGAGAIQGVPESAEGKPV
jgi:hypothetical protein